MKLPALFLSHGSPMMALEDSPARRFLAEWASQQPRPEAILVVSAHWENLGGPAVSLAEQPETIHDFGGFPHALYQLKYPAHGAPDVARQAASLLRRAGFSVRAADNRGLDHGAWVPLSVMYPQADVPVCQVSLIHEAGPEAHFRLGRALQPLREQGVLVIGSGSLTHNLYEFVGHSLDDPAPAWVSSFAEWIAETLAAGRVDDLMNYRKLAPHAARNHPGEDHLLPLFVALGAGGEAPAINRVHASNSYGVLAMDAYVFGDGKVAAGAPAPSPEKVHA